MKTTEIISEFRRRLRLENVNIAAIVLNKGDSQAIEDDLREDRLIPNGTLSPLLRKSPMKGIFKFQYEGIKVYEVEV